MDLSDGIDYVGVVPMVRALAYVFYGFDWSH